MDRDIGRSAEYIIFLREPVMRFVSLYRHHVAMAINLSQSYPSFNEWSKHAVARTMVEETICASNLSGSRIERAKFILDRCSFIGLQETFASDVAQLFPAYASIPMDNVSDKKFLRLGVPLPTLNQSEMHSVHEIVSEDKEFYIYAEQLRQQGHNNNFILKCPGGDNTIMPRF
jgi:hypothetical protein